MLLKNYHENENPSKYKNELVNALKFEIKSTWTQYKRYEAHDVCRPIIQCIRDIAKKDKIFKQ